MKKRKDEIIIKPSLKKIEEYIVPIVPLSWRDKLRRILDIYGLRKYQDRILGVIKYRFPIKKYHVRDENTINIGLSKLGGNPDVPVDFEWPYWNNRPLSFLMQVNLEDLKNFEVNPFPKQKGLVYFFYDPLQEDWGIKFAKNEGAWRVIYSNDDKSNLFRVRNPSKNKEFTYPTCIVTFYQDIHLPCFFLSGEDIDPYTPEFFINSPLEFDFRLDPYGRFHSDFFGGYRLDNHALFGYPDEIQELGKMTGWCQLLQLGDDEMLRWVWGHHGRIHFMIKEIDLKRNYYDKVHLIMDCY